MRSFSKFPRSIIRLLRLRARNVTGMKTIKEIFFYLSYFFRRSLEAVNGSRFFRLPLYAHEKYGHPISGAVVRFAHPERHHWVVVPGRTLRNSAGPSNKEWPYVYTRQVPLLPLEPRPRRREHCTNIVHCSRRRYEPAGASRSYFIEAGRPPPSIDRLVKCPRATVPRHRDTVRAPFRQETWYVGDKRVKGGSFDQKERESAPILSAPGPQSCVYHPAARSLPMRLFAADDIARAKWGYIER